MAVAALPLSRDPTGGLKRAVEADPFAGHGVRRLYHQRGAPGRLSSGRWAAQERAS